MNTQKIEWTNKKGWFKISIILGIFISLILSLLTFQGEAIDALFTEETAVGFGIISLFASWLFFLATTTEANGKVITVKRILFIALTITGMILVSSLAGFIMSSIVIVGAIGYYVWVGVGS